MLRCLFSSLRMTQQTKRVFKNLRVRVTEYAAAEFHFRTPERLTRRSQKIIFSAFLDPV